MLLALWFCCENCYDKPKNCYDKPKNCYDKPNEIKFLGTPKMGDFHRERCKTVSGLKSFERMKICFETGQVQANEC